MTPLDIPTEEAQKILEEMIIPQVIGSITPKQNREAFILGGQPGSGKSAFAREILRTDSAKAFVNGDDLRAYHPKYHFYLKENDIEAADLTQPVCNFWIESLIRECVARGVDFIVEGTMRKKDVPLSTARFLKNNEYNVNVVAVSTPYELSLKSLEYRYSELKRLGMPARYTKKESHDEAFRNIENTLVELSESGLFSTYHICRRSTDGFHEKVFFMGDEQEMLKDFREGRARIIEKDELERFLVRQRESMPLR